MKLYDKTSFAISKVTTNLYSTSFSIAVSFLSSEMKRAIYSIYGFVRFADEIVDTFLEYNQEQLLHDFEQDLYKALEQKISLNPILHSFAITVEKYHIPLALIQSFLESMKMDLHKKDYSTKEELNSYIYGSADVVGLMCLQVFVKGKSEEYKKLEYSATKLGSAFQKVNFLRDLKSDVEFLHRQYFPEFNRNTFNEESKNQIIKSIQKDFDEAFVGLQKLPKDSRLAVYIAYVYYNALLQKIKNKKASEILTHRIRIHNFTKIFLLCKAYVYHTCNVL